MISVPLLGGPGPGFLLLRSQMSPVSYVMGPTWFQTSSFSNRAPAATRDLFRIVWRVRREKGAQQMFHSHDGGLPHAQTERGYTTHRRVERDPMCGGNTVTGVCVCCAFRSSTPPKHTHPGMWLAAWTQLECTEDLPVLSAKWPLHPCSCGVLAWEVSQLGSLPPAVELVPPTPLCVE